MISRGLRNHNPGNLRDQGIPWLGLADPHADDGGYLVFVDDLHGIRALARDIFTKFTRDKLRCVADIIERYAPPGDHNDTVAYITAVSKALHVSPTHILTMDADTLCRIVRAVIVHENGSCPFTPDLIAQAVGLGTQMMAG